MRLAAIFFSVLACAVAGAAPAWAVERPDVVIQLPGKPFPGQVAPVYIDTFERPGRVLYRFDATLKNRGGTLDLFRADGGPVMQALWDGGNPPRGAKPAADAVPRRSGAVRLLNRSKVGASMRYVVEPDHSHFHFMRIARYELRVRNRRPRVSEKIGFCFYDGFENTGGPETFFPEPNWDSGERTWCAMLEPEANAVRMGLSPGASDRYGSQKYWQWVDVTGLRPGPYTLRGIANPRRYVVESNTANNVIRRRRTVPGVLLGGGRLSAPVDGSGAVSLRGRVVAPSIPARRSAECEPSPDELDCYVKASRRGPLWFDLARAPRHGTVSLDARSGLSTRAVYTPEPGFSGRDSFSVTATDSRGLTSRPARVAVRVSGAATGSAVTAVGAASGPSVTRVSTAAGTGPVPAQPARVLDAAWHSLAIGTPFPRSPYSLLCLAGPGLAGTGA